MSMNKKIQAPFFSFATQQATTHLTMTRQRRFSPTCRSFWPAILHQNDNILTEYAMEFQRVTKQQQSIWRKWSFCVLSCCVLPFLLNRPFWTWRRHSWGKVETWSSKAIIYRFIVVLSLSKILYRSQDCRICNRFDGSVRPPLISWSAMGEVCELRSYIVSNCMFDVFNA